ncbi:MAG: biotin/lipoyl-binding protein [Clostridia bacterium]|nr:biotin/lipoyl-binding protein [Clostridia bacterium]
MKQLKITVNGKAYDVQVEEIGASAAPVVAAPVVAAPVASTPAAPIADTAPVEAPAPAAAPTAGEGEAITAPMPGNILKVLVSAGTAVKKGDVLLILEAMKMENEICAPADGVVTAVMVTTGETVDSGKAMLTLK